MSTFPEAGETYDVVYTCHKVTYVVVFIDPPLHFLASFLAINEIGMA